MFCFNFLHFFFIVLLKRKQMKRHMKRLYHISLPWVMQFVRAISARLGTCIRHRIPWAPLKSIFKIIRIHAFFFFFYKYVFLSPRRCLSAPSKIISVRWNTAGHYGVRLLDEQMQVIAACEGAWRVERVIATISLMALTWHRAAAACDCPQIHNPLFVFF